MNWRERADEWRATAEESDNVHWQLFCYKEVAFCEEMARMMDEDA